MSMVLTTVKHLNLAKAEAIDSSERCAIKSETDTGTANEGDAETSITSGDEISIRSVSVSNDNIDSVSMAFGSSGEADFGHSGSVTVASGNAQQQAGSIAMASSTITRKRNAKHSTLQSRKTGTAARNEYFEGRYKQLIDFIDEFGRCNVPWKLSANPSLGTWCSAVR
jgi:hypothetical protein